MDNQPLINFITIAHTAVEIQMSNQLNPVYMLIIVYGVISIPLIKIEPVDAWPCLLFQHHN